jgi:hypothetical protein
VLTIQTDDNALNFYGIFKASDADDADVQRDIATFSGQSYFFIRDVVHTHQHHPPDQDKIITLHNVSDGNDRGWAAASVRSLFNKVIEFKQMRTTERCISALGVLAYFRTFMKITRQTHNARDDHAIQMYDENLQQSIDTTLRECEVRERRNTERKNIWLVGIFGVLAATMACVSVLSLSNYEVIMKGRAPSPVIIKVAEAFMAKPLTMTAVAFLVTYFLIVSAPRWAGGKGN